jgi:hypothetical protein
VSRRACGDAVTITFSTSLRSPSAIDAAWATITASPRWATSSIVARIRPRRSDSTGASWPGT